MCVFSFLLNLSNCLKLNQLNQHIQHVFFLRKLQLLHTPLSHKIAPAPITTVYNKQRINCASSSSIVSAIKFATYKINKHKVLFFKKSHEAFRKTSLHYQFLLLSNVS